MIVTEAAIALASSILVQIISRLVCYVRRDDEGHWRYGALLNRNETPKHEPRSKHAKSLT